MTISKQHILKALRRFLGSSEHRNPWRSAKSPVGVHGNHVFSHPKFTEYTLSWCSIHLPVLMKFSSRKTLMISIHNMQVSNPCQVSDRPCAWKMRLIFGRLWKGSTDPAFCIFMRASLRLKGHLWWERYGDWGRIILLGREEGLMWASAAMCHRDYEKPFQDPAIH